MLANQVTLFPPSYNKGWRHELVPALIICQAIDVRPSDSRCRMDHYLRSIHSVHYTY